MARKWTAAEKKAFAEKMKRARAAKARGRAPAKSNPPKAKAKTKRPKAKAKRPASKSKAKHNPPAPRKSNGQFKKKGFFAKSKSKARHNPPSTGAMMAAAGVGGLVAYAGSAMVNAVTSDPTARNIGSVLVPLAVAGLALAMNNEHSVPAMCGAIGVGIGVGGGRAVGTAIAAKNPPGMPNWSWNPPPPPDRLVAGHLPSAWASPFRA